MRIKVGEHVMCRGRYAYWYSLAGIVEDTVPENPEGVYLYGVRLANGNYKLFPADDVRKKGA